MNNWKEFRESGLLWWVNRSLHLFGWSIVCVVNSDGTVVNVYPIKVSYRGFTEEAEAEGFKTLTQYLKESASSL